MRRAAIEEWREKEAERQAAFAAAGGKGGEPGGGGGDGQGAGGDESAAPQVRRCMLGRGRGGMRHKGGRQSVGRRRRDGGPASGTTRLCMRARCSRDRPTAESESPPLPPLPLPPPVQFVAYVPLPDQKEIEAKVLEGKKAALLRQYISEDEAAKQQQARELLNRR